MDRLRFGRKLSLPSTISIKHQFRTLAAQRETEKAEAEGRVDVFRAQPNPASEMPITEIDAANSFEVKSRVVERSGDHCLDASSGRW
jgi:hypothetical protein